LRLDDFDYFFDKFLRQKAVDISLPSIFESIKFVSCFYCEDIKLEQIPTKDIYIRSHEDLLSSVNYQLAMLQVVQEARKNYS
jgi:hypothetical protein